MNMDQLSLILEAVGKASEGAALFAYLWLAKEALTSILTASVFGGLIFSIFKVVNTLISSDK